MNDTFVNKKLSSEFDLAKNRIESETQDKINELKAQERIAIENELELARDADMKLNKRKQAEEYWALYSSLKECGFSEDQAMEILIKAMGTFMPYNYTYPCPTL